MFGKFLLPALLIFSTGTVQADWARDQIGLTETGQLDCSGVTIAYMDTGVNVNSPYLAGSLWENPNPEAGDVHGYNFVDNSGEVDDLDGHGTTVAHALAANNGDPDSMGICSKAQIMVLKISDGGSTTIPIIRQALNYAVNNGADIILMTTGLILQGGFPPFGLKNRISQSTSTGAIFIHAATNLTAVPAASASLNHPREAWPYLVPDRFHPVRNALAIGGSTALDLPWLGGFRHPEKVHLAAPAQGVTVVNGEGEIQKLNGNSIAAGLAAGMAAAYWTAHPEKSSTEVVQALLDSSIKKEAYLHEFASGRMSLPDLMSGTVHPVPEYRIEGQESLGGGTSNPYRAPQTTEWQFSKPGAEYVRVVFSHITLGNCWSLSNQTKVTIIDGEGNPVQEFVCENRPPSYRLPSVFVKGDTITVRFESQETSNPGRAGLAFRFLEWASRLNPEPGTL